MQCTNCGKELTTEDTFCNNCGLAVKDVSQPTFTDVSNHFENGGQAATQGGIPLESQSTGTNDTIPYNQVVQEQPAAAPVETPAVVQPEVAQPTVAPVQEPAPAIAPVQAEVQPVVTPTVATEAPATVASPLAPPAQTATVTTEVVQQPAAPAPVEQPVVVEPVQQPTVAAPVEQPVVQTTATAEVPKTELQPPPVTESTNLGGNPAVAQVMGSDFAAEREAASKIPSGGFGPAPIVDPPIVVQTVSGPGYQPNLGAKKGISGAVLAIILVVAAVAFLGIGLFVGSIVFSKTVSKGEGNEPVITPSESAVVTVTFGGAKFNIPDDYYDYDLEDDKLAVYNDDIYFYIMIAPKSYTQYNSNIPYLKKYYEGLGYIVSSAREDKVGDQRYIILDMSNNSGKVSLFIRAFTNTECLTGAIAKTTDSFATSKDLNDVETILSTSQIVTKTIKNSKKDYYNEVLKGILEANFDETSSTEQTTTE